MQVRPLRFDEIQGGVGLLRRVCNWIHGRRVWMGLLDRKEGWGSRWGSKSAGRILLERKKVRPKTSGTTYETVAVLPLAGLCFLAVKLAVEEEN